MKKSWQVFLIATVLMLCAGVVVGRLSVRLAVATPVAAQGHRPSWLQDQLDLSTDQKQQMDGIWAEVQQQMATDRNRRRDFDRERDDAVQNLLSDQQKLMYQEIYNEYHTKRQQMEIARDSLVKNAEERSRALLSDSQKQRWDQMSKDWEQHGRDMHGGHHGPGPGDGFGPTTQRSGGHELSDHAESDQESSH